MKKSFLKKVFIHFICVFFLALMAGVSVPEAENRGLPIGEMVSKGEVKVITKNTQERVTSSVVPVFPGNTIGTDRGGAATIRLSNHTQVALDEDSTLSFDRPDRLTLSKGKIEFYIRSSDVKILAGRLSLVKSRVQQVQSGPASSPKDDAVSGTMTIEPDGTVKISNFHGRVSILTADNSLLAALGPREMLTVPKQGERKLEVAQADEGENKTAEEKKEEKRILGLKPLTAGIAGGVILVGGGIGAAAAAGGGGGGGGGGRAACP